MDTKVKKIELAYINGNMVQKVFKNTRLDFGTIKCRSKLVTYRIQSILYKNITHNETVKYIRLHSKPHIGLNSIETN